VDKYSIVVGCSSTIILYHVYSNRPLSSGCDRRSGTDNPDGLECAFAIVNRLSGSHYNDLSVRNSAFTHSDVGQRSD
jgi:hypothetical protein